MKRLMHRKMKYLKIFKRRNEMNYIWYTIAWSFQIRWVVEESIRVSSAFIVKLDRFHIIIHLHQHSVHSNGVTLWNKHTQRTFFQRSKPAATLLILNRHFNLFPSSSYLSFISIKIPSHSFHFKFSLHNFCIKINFPKHVTTYLHHLTQIFDKSISNRRNVISHTSQKCHASNYQIVVILATNSMKPSNVIIYFMVIAQ